MYVHEMRGEKVFYYFLSFRTLDEHKNSQKYKHICITLNLLLNFNTFSCKLLD